MQPTHLLLRQGELFLKGKNRTFFERKLLQHMRSATGIKEVKHTQGRIILPFFLEHYKLKRIMGITSYSPAYFVSKDPEKIKELALSILKEKQGTFRIQTNRADKTFPYPSPQFNRLVGEYIEQNSALSFSLTEAKYILNVEINQEGVYLFLEHYPCLGGLPLGVEGRAILLLEDENSILAGLLMMKRGVSLYLVSLQGEKDISLLQEFSPQKLYLKTLLSFSEMDSFAQEKEITSFVSSQTLGSYKKYPSSLVVFRPLVGYTPQGITEEKSFFNSLCI